MTSTYVNLYADEQHEEKYASTNPNKTIPVLVSTTGNHSFTVAQSVAAMEYLDEAFPETYQLLPSISQPELRATVRTLVGIFVSDIQGPTTLRTRKRVKALATAAGTDPDEAVKTWARTVFIAGFTGCEAILKEVAGRYCVGDSVTMADCCLVPAVWNAEGFDIDLAPFPTLKRVYEELSRREEVVKSHWRNQEDTPKELRA